MRNGSPLWLELRRRDGVRVPAILEGYCLSICSAILTSGRQGESDRPAVQLHADDRVGDALLEPGTTVRLCGNGLLDDSAGVVYGRAHLDAVGARPRVAHEYAAHRLYARWGLPTAPRLSSFQGGHSINGEGTFAFLKKHLDWPQESGGIPRGGEMNRIADAFRNQLSDQS